MSRVIGTVDRRMRNRTRKMDLGVFCRVIGRGSLYRPSSHESISLEELASLSLSTVAGIKAHRGFLSPWEDVAFQSQNTCYIKSLNELADLSCSHSHWVREEAQRKPGQGLRARGPVPHANQHHPALGLESCP